MCRMLVAVGNVDVNSLLDGMLLMAKDQNSIHELNKKQGRGSWKHGDGWGTAYLDKNGEWVIKKSTKAIYEDPEIEDLRNLKTNLFILHTRFKMGSETSTHNTHPFRFDKENGETFVFCHNGFIDEEIDYDKKYELKGDTDSEKLFYSILTDLKRSNVTKAIRKNLKRYKKLTGTNIILSTKKNTIVATRKNKFPKYYQMSLGRTKDMIVVSSEQFNTNHSIFWEPLNQGDIININNKKIEAKISREILKEKKHLKHKFGSLFGIFSKNVKKNNTNLVTYQDNNKISDGN